MADPIHFQRLDVQHQSRAGRTPVPFGAQPVGPAMRAVMQGGPAVRDTMRQTWKSAAPGQCVRLVLATVALVLGLSFLARGQDQDLAFLSQMTSDVVQACRIQPGHSVNGSPTNTVGFTLIMPGGNGGYPAFWVRDFAMSVDAGYITAQEMSNHLQLIAACQNGPAAVHLANGLVLPPYAIPDHIEFDGSPTFYPGTYATGSDQGNGTYGLLPPADDHYWFVHVAYALFRAQRSAAFLSNAVNGMTMIDRLAAAFNSPTTDPQTGLFETFSTNRAVGFGFCDGIYFTGKVLFPSLLRYQAAGELAALYQALGQPDAATPYLRIKGLISTNLAPTFAGPAGFGGWLKAATGVGGQADVWGTLYALHLGALSGAAASNAKSAVVTGLTNGTIASNAAVRHVPANLDYSATSAWQQTGETLDTYQNGAYWHTPSGWLIEALAATHSALASQVFGHYLQYLRANDYRLKRGPQAPWECFYPPAGYTQHGVYMTSVTVPCALLSNLGLTLLPAAPGITGPAPRLLASLATAQPQTNLVEDPSFEMTKDKDQFGLVFAKWGGWKYEGECEFAVGRVAHSGRTSCLLKGGTAPKIRVAQLRDLAPGRYRVTAWLRGLDIGAGLWNQTTEFMFADKYMQLNRGGTFDWTRLTYVAELKEQKQAGPSFGLMAPGYFWIDDVSLERVADSVPLTEQPVLGPEAAPLAPPGDLGPDAVRCAECGYRNQPAWTNCYACGTPLGVGPVATGPALKLITSFEDKNPFDAGVIVEQHATDGKHALRLDRNFAGMDGAQDWTGYDYLKADLFTDAHEPLELYVEIRDKATGDYWTRVNYQTVVPPGQSTLVLPLKQLYVGEKSRPGRKLMLNAITRFILNINEKPAAPLYVDNLRLERDDSAQRVRFDGLYAFDLGPASGPVMEGFTPISPATAYSRGRGYGLNDAHIWRAFDVLQPDPLYQDFICFESGGLAVDVPNGKYRVFVNLDNPSGFWGEYQVYRRRAVTAQGREVVVDTMDFDTLKRKYFRFWNVEDLPADNTFDKYQQAYYQEKVFDVDVTDGQLNLGFRGENWACSVSAVVIYPVAKAAQGERFLDWVKAKRRFYFDNYFKRVLHTPTGPPLQPTAEDQARGYVLFSRDPMKELYYNDTPFPEELGRPLAVEAFAGQAEPATLGVLPLRELGNARVTVSPLAGPAATLPADCVDLGYVSYRLSRVTMEGSVYTISPRLILPTNAVALPAGVARRFWLTFRPPTNAAAGVYRGQVTVSLEKGATASLPIELRVRAGTLDPLDLPAGPWGYAIRTPWYEDDPAAAAFHRQLAEKSLRKMREYGFTMCSGFPEVRYMGFKNGQPVLDFGNSDALMKLARDLGFLAVSSYGGGVSGLNAYYVDRDQMQAAGFGDYSAFIKALYTAIQQHADQQHWLPVYWNLADEPLGDDLKRSAENAAAYHQAFPQGPPFFTGASSFTGNDRNDPHFQLSQALHVADWNGHDEAAIALLHEKGGEWAFYNGGNRWTFGDYLYKAAKQFNLKFRLSWHWNAAAGDPYYALDCREDDYAWCTATPDGELLPAVHFEQLRAGLEDYRHLLTLARLAREQKGAPAALAAENLIAARLAAFKLGQREHDELFGPDDWRTSRRKLADAIEALRK